MLVKLEIPPGLYSQGTEYQGQGRWRRSNLVRWRNGTMSPVRGWQRFSDALFLGRVSDIHQYRDGSDRRGGFGSELALYAILPNGNYRDITPDGYQAGRQDSQKVFGYGLSLYGTNVYGISIPETQDMDMGGSIQSATNWSIDNFGTFLVACADTDGRLYFWDTITPKAMVIPNAPMNNKGVIVSEERFVFALGADNDGTLVRWSDQEDFNVWTEAATNQAGSFKLQTNGSILGAVRIRGQLLILTTSDAHTATYQGPPFVYGFERVGTSCGALGPQAAVATDTLAAWMGPNGFYVYDGFVRPLESSVADFVYGDLNLSQVEKVAAWNNAANGEIWWHYPSASSNECDRYVAWNYRENTWSAGEMIRTCGSGDGVYPAPILAGIDGYLYQHEVGFQYDGARPFAETGPFELGTGDNTFMSRHLYPDEKTQGDVRVAFRTRFYPNAPETLAGPYSLQSPTSVRFTGRQVVMRVESVVNADWRFGVPRLDVQAGGLR